MAAAGSDLEPGFESFAAFVAARQLALLRSAYLICGDHHLAQDLLQGALTKLALRWETVRLGYPDAFVRKVMYRDLISWRRRFRRETLTRDVIDSAPTARLDATAVVDNRLLLEQALAQLTVKQRAALVLRYFDDLTEAQTAELLGVTTGTVKSQVHAALARLRTVAPDLREFLDPGRAQR